MIKNSIPMSMAESLKYIKDAEVKAFIKKFTKLNETKAEELRKKIVQLNFVKLNDKSISKIIDLMPREKDEISKLLSNSNLNENEITTILSTIKQYN